MSQFLSATSAESALHRDWASMARMSFLILPPAFLSSLSSPMLLHPPTPPYDGEPGEGFNDLDTFSFPFLWSREQTLLSSYVHIKPLTICCDYEQCDG